MSHDMDLYCRDNICVLSIISGMEITCDMSHDMDLYCGDKHVCSIISGMEIASHTGHCPCMSDKSSECLKLYRTGHDLFNSQLSISMLLSTRICIYSGTSNNETSL